MSIYTTMRRQHAVYWPPGGTDEFGRTVLGEPQAILCRWDDASQQYLNPTSGTVEISRARVYVGVDVVPGGYLWLGALADLPDPDPRNVPAAAVVQRVDRNPNLKATATLITAIM